MDGGKGRSNARCGALAGKPAPSPARRETGAQAAAERPARSAYREALYGRPSVTMEPYCSVCGRPGVHGHHVIAKGAGGVTAAIDRRIPLVNLCPRCHDLVHKRRMLHLNWCDGMGGWVYLVTRRPMDDELCWNLNKSDYRPLPGWTRMRLWGRPIGGAR